jgi:hypothetical protein
MRHSAQAFLTALVVVAACSEDSPANMQGASPIGETAGMGAGAAAGGGAGTGTGSSGTMASGSSGRGGAGASGTAASGRGGSGVAGTGGMSAAAGSAAGAGSGGMAGAADGGTGGMTAMPAEPKYNDPGTQPWMLVPTDKVADECKLDPTKLAEHDSEFTSGWAVVRYGKLCHEAGPRDTPTEAYSATKTLGGLVTGIASYETRMFQKTGPKTGQLLDTDLASHWLTSQSYNKDAYVGHVLGMEAHNADLSWGKKTYMYDTVGSVQINTLGTMVNAAISQDSARLTNNIESFTKKFLFEAIGMTDSTWTGAVYAYTWSTTLHDMARVGVLMVHQGLWGGKRILDESWIYKMTHPSFEDANTGYGYLTWLNARVGSTGPGGAFGGTALDTCAPATLWPKYPHPLSNAPDCNYQGMSCEQEFDVGAWSAQGAGGQFIVGHPGLDLVIVAKNYANMGGPEGMWNAVRPALVALDPKYKGDEMAFCEVYGANKYAPDLQKPWTAPYDAPATMMKP